MKRLMLNRMLYRMLDRKYQLIANLRYFGYLRYLSYAGVGLLGLASFESVAINLSFFQSAEQKQTRLDLKDPSVATAWADQTLAIMKKLKGTPTGDSRMLGYMGLAMYEAVVNGQSSYQSIAPQLNGAPSFPMPDKQLHYAWPEVLNSAEASLLRKFIVEKAVENEGGFGDAKFDLLTRASELKALKPTFVGIDLQNRIQVLSRWEAMKLALKNYGTKPIPVSESPYGGDPVLSIVSGVASIEDWVKESRAHQVNKDDLGQIETLNQRITSQVAQNWDDATMSRSKELGENMAQSIWLWAEKDHTHSVQEVFPTAFVPPKTGPQYWTPPSAGQSSSTVPLHPYWGQNRTFLSQNSTLPMPEILPYSTDKNSAYYQDFKAVYDLSNRLKMEQMKIAAWWSDDPTKSYSPPAHSYYLANEIVKQHPEGLIKAAQTYAAVGMSTADSFINCWKVKYHYYSQRPASYIRANIDPNWKLFWPEPPFPAFPSGHGTQAGASSQVLIGLYGDQMAITDQTHAGRDDYMLDRDGAAVAVKFTPRSFKTITELATEVNQSRMYGGIHSPQDNAVGVKMGHEIGNHILQLKWVK